MIGELGETWTLDVWTKWHKKFKLNFVPSFDSVTIMGDDRAHKPIARMYEAKWLGIVVWVTRPTSVGGDARKFL